MKIIENHLIKACIYVGFAVFIASISMESYAGKRKREQSYEQGQEFSVEQEPIEGANLTQAPEPPEKRSRGEEIKAEEQSTSHPSPQEPSTQDHIPSSISQKRDKGKAKEEEEEEGEGKTQPDELVQDNEEFIKALNSGKRLSLELLNVLKALQGYPYNQWPATFNQTETSKFLRDCQQKSHSLSYFCTTAIAELQKNLPEKGIGLGKEDTSEDLTIEEGEDARLGVFKVLPKELLAPILANLSLEDIIKLGSINKELRAIIGNPYLWHPQLRDNFNLLKSLISWEGKEEGKDLSLFDLPKQTISTSQEQLLRHTGKTYDVVHYGDDGKSTPTGKKPVESYHELMEGGNLGKVIQHLDLKSTVQQNFLLHYNGRELQAFPNLKTLYMSHKTSNYILNYLELLPHYCPKLEHLRLGNVQDFCTRYAHERKNTLESLPQLTRLTSLDIRGCRIGVDDLKIIKKIGMLTRLKLDSFLGKGHLNEIGRMGNLTHLNLGESVIENVCKDSFQKAIKRLKSLNKLNLSKTSIHDQDLNTLPKSIQRLNLSDTSVTDIGIESIVKNLPKLRKLKLVGCKLVTNRGMMAMLTKCKNSEELDLSNTPITDAALKYIAESSPELQELKLAECQNITDKGVGTLLQKCKNLKRLDLSGAPITDAALKYIAESSPELQELKLAECQNITDKGVVTLPITLEHLDLSECPKVSDACVTFLEKLSRLKKLYIKGTSISAYVWHHLATVNENLKIDR